MTRTAKTASSEKDDAVNAEPEATAKIDSAGGLNTETTTETTLPASSETGGSGDPVDSTETATVARQDKPDDDAAAAASVGEVLCRVRSVGGPRRRAGLSFDETARPLTRADLGATNAEAEERLRLLLADPRLSVLPPDRE